MFVRHTTLSGHIDLVFFLGAYLLPDDEFFLGIYSFMGNGLDYDEYPSAEPKKHTICNAV